MSWVVVWYVVMFLWENIIDVLLVSYWCVIGEYNVEC